MDSEWGVRFAAKLIIFLIFYGLHHLEVHYLGMSSLEAWAPLILWLLIVISYDQAAS